MNWKGTLVQENDETLNNEIKRYKFKSRFYLFTTFLLIALLCTFHITLYLKKQEIECVIFYGDDQVYCDMQSIRKGLKIVRNIQNET